jgi:signal transduction histidine kinase
MQFSFFLLIFLFVYIKNKLQTKTTLPKWNNVFTIGIILCISLLITEGAYNDSLALTSWIAILMLFALSYYCLIKKEFKLVKNVAYSIIPLTVINFLEECISIFYKNFYIEYGDFVDAADTFALTWFVIILFIDNRQRKTIAKERLIALEKEKELQITTKLKAELEIEVKERTTEILKQKEELQKIVDELKSTQTQLVQQEKLASLGALTAGIAHEIKNPLNFVNNFSELSTELVDEFIRTTDETERQEIGADLKINLQKINEHGKRADSIVKNMLQHSRSGSGEKQLTDINQICEEYFNLAFHGKRAIDANFNCEMVKNLDNTIPQVNCVVQDISRVFLNLINNAFDAVRERELEGKTPSYKPSVTLTTKQINNTISISISDNGKGIPQHIKEKIFEPFFTTKPAGQGTGLGLSLSYDIVKAHGGEMRLETVEGEGSEFVIQLPNN